MTTPIAQPVNVAGEGSQVGVQAGNAYIDTVTLHGDVQLTVGQDALPEAKYRAGVENLKSGNPRTARKLIWDAMMSGHAGNGVLFHWLVAMLSGRTVQQFSEDEIDQLKLSRLRYAGTGGDAWADGVRLIYRLLDSALPLSAGAERKTAAADMSLLVEQVDDLGEKQRDMVRPHLELFLTGPLKDELWRRELRHAQSGQRADDRPGRAWMFFQPVPAEACLPSPPPETASAGRRLEMRASACLFAAAAGYLGWELLWHSAFLGLLSYVAALAGGAVAAVNDLELRFLDQRRRRTDELFRASNQSVPSPPGDELTDGVDRLLNRYFVRYAPDKAERERWETAVAGFRKFHRDEIIEICRRSGIPANEVAWLIRYEVRQLKRRWQNETLHEYRRQLLPRPGTVAARRTGLAVLVLGGIWAVVALRAHPLADPVALASAFWAWRCWLRASLGRRTRAADSDEHAQRQAAIDKEFRRWSEELAARPKDAETAAWLGCDRTVLLGRALDHFHLPPRRLIAHAFVEQPGVAARRARIEGGPWRYAMYRFQLLLLAEDGVRQVRANLDFMTGTLTIRERASYRYDAIASVRFLQETRRQTFELRLTTGELITIRVRDADPGEAQQDHDAGQTEETHEAAEAEADTAPDATSMVNLLHMLERAAGEGQNWFRGRDWARTRPDDDEADRWAVRRGEEDA
jgi:hypothetical protein